MDDELEDFVVRRVIRRMVDDKIDCDAVAVMSDEELAKYVPAYGDRIALMAFAKCKIKKESNSETTLATSTLHQLGRRNNSRQAGNKNAQKKSRKLELGWLNFTSAELYKQVRAKSGGGTRHFPIDKNVTVNNILHVATATFFPGEVSKLGHLTDFDCKIKDFKGDSVPDEKNIEDLYRESHLKTLRLYLYTQSREQGAEIRLQEINDAHDNTDQGANVSKQKGDEAMSSVMSVQYSSDAGPSDMSVHDLPDLPDVTVTRCRAQHTPSVDQSVSSTAVRAQFDTELGTPEVVFHPRFRRNRLSLYKSNVEPSTSTYRSYIDLLEPITIPDSDEEEVQDVSSKDQSRSYIDLLEPITIPDSDEEEVQDVSSKDQSSCPTLIELLVQLQSQVNEEKISKFNITRSDVLDGARRSIRRKSFYPKYKMDVRFTDTFGASEGAIDEGGPKREFLRMLMLQLQQLPVFEGQKVKGYFQAKHIMPKKYSQKNLLDAVAAVRQGLSYRKASVKYGVPSMTIQNRVSGKIDDLAVAGRPTVIPPEIEEEIVKKIKKAADMGFGITRRMLQVKVGRMVRKLGIKTPFRNGIPGKDWVARFLSRHKDISLRKPLALSTCRARMLNKTVTDNFYKDLQGLLIDTGLHNQPMKIWNIDETSVPLLHKPAKVLGQTGAKNIPGRVGNSRDNVSVLVCINAAGGHIPPLAIVKGKTYKSLLAYNTEEGVPGTVYTYQERAWMEDALGELWFKDHFLKHCGPERPQIIIMDSHSSHETLGLIDAAIANDIIFLAFPPHTTQWLCPLDKTIFGPLSREFSRVCTEFMASSPNNIVNKWEWPRLFKQAFTKAFTTANITSGFRKCGIYPVDSGALPASALAPSEPFDISNKNELNSVSSLSKCANENLVAEMDSNYSPPEKTVPVATTSVAAEPFSGEVLSEEKLINLVLSGACPYTVDTVTGNIELQIEVSDCASPSEAQLEPVPSNHDCSTEVNATFALPVSDRKINENKQNSRKLTSHRILTSKEVVDKKREDFDKKNKIKVEKEKRQQMKLLKKEKNDLQKIKKNVVQ